MFFLENVGFNLQAANGVLGTILQAARSLFYWLSELIYKFIIVLYQLFEDMATARLLDNDMLEIITNKISIVLGIIMLFVVIFDFIHLLIDPEKMFDKEKGMFSIIKRILFVLVGLAISGFVFELLFQFQNYVIENKVLYKIILPVSDTDIDTDNFGKVLAARTFTSFYYAENLDKSVLDANGISDLDICVDYDELLVERIAKNGEFSVGNYCLNSVAKVTSGSETYDVFIMNYNFLLQIAAGIGIVYILVNYVIKVGVRLIQLTVLQIVSPIFIVGYLSPKKENMFSKWWNVYFSTYIDIFIRLLIIYFIVYLCSLILDGFNDPANSVFWNSIGKSSNVNLIVVVMILALLTFAKKAPELIKDLIPAGASKLGLGASMKDIVGLNKGINTVAGLGTGAAIGLIGGIAGGKGISRFTGALGGVLGGAFRGGTAGFGAKGFVGAISTAGKNQAKVNMARAERIFNGGSWGAGLSDSVLGGIGMMSSDKILNEQISAQDALEDAIAKNTKVKAIDTQMSNLTIGGLDHEGKTITNQADLESAYEYYKNQKKIASARALAESISKDKGDNIQLYAQRLSRQDSTSKGQISNIIQLVANEGKKDSKVSEADILAAYKDFGDRNDDRKNKREKNRIQKGK